MGTKDWNGRLSSLAFLAMTSLTRHWLQKLQKLLGNVCFSLLSVDRHLQWSAGPQNGQCKSKLAELFPWLC